MASSLWFAFGPSGTLAQCMNSSDARTLWEKEAVPYPAHLAHEAGEAIALLGSSLGACLGQGAYTYMHIYSFVYVLSANFFMWYIWDVL